MAHASKESFHVALAPGGDVSLARSEVKEFLSAAPRRFDERIESEPMDEWEELEEFEEIEVNDSLFARGRAEGDILANRTFGLRRTERSAAYVAEVDDARPKVGGEDATGAAEIQETGACEGLIKVGQELRTRRRDLGWGLADLAAKTKISIETLKLIEAGDERDLPERVFVRGFVRCCARAMELDGDELVEMLADPLPVPKALTKGQNLRRAPASAGRWTASVPAVQQRSFAVYLSLALLVVFVTLFALVSDLLSKGTVHAL